MRYLLTISLFAVSIALGAWAYVDHKQAEQDRKVGHDVYNPNAGRTMIASLLVGMLGLGSLYGARRRRLLRLRKGDFDFLSARLSIAGIAEADIEELKVALQADPPPRIVRHRFSIRTIAELGFIGDQVGAWIKKAVGQLGEKYPDSTVEELEQLVGTLIFQYYGWD
jgi:hypothetical protein